MHHTLIAKCIQPKGWIMDEKRSFKNILCNVGRAGYLSRRVEQEASLFGLIRSSSLGGEASVKHCLAEVLIWSSQASPR